MKSPQAAPSGWLSSVTLDCPVSRQIQGLVGKSEPVLCQAATSKTVISFWRERTS